MNSDSVVLGEIDGESCVVSSKIERKDSDQLVIQIQNEKGKIVKERSIGMRELMPVHGGLIPVKSQIYHGHDGEILISFLDTYLISLTKDLQDLHHIFRLPSGIEVYSKREFTSLSDAAVSNLSRLTSLHKGKCPPVWTNQGWYFSMYRQFESLDLGDVNNSKHLIRRVKKEVLVTTIPARSFNKSLGIGFETIGLLNVKKGNELAILRAAKVTNSLRIVKRFGKDASNLALAFSRYQTNGNSLELIEEKSISDKLVSKGWKVFWINGVVYPESSRSLFLVMELSKEGRDNKCCAFEIKEDATVTLVAEQNTAKAEFVSFSNKFGFRYFDDTIKTNHRYAVYQNNELKTIWPPK